MSECREEVSEYRGNGGGEGVCVCDMCACLFRMCVQGVGGEEGKNVCMRVVEGEGGGAYVRVCREEGV